MANEEHLARLKQGVETWNRWRNEHPAIRPDLSEADLTRADLSGAHLFEADLRGANLTGATLFKADLTGAALTMANLTAADLTEANLTGADLHAADLTGANLAAATLIKTILHLANLTGANLTAATLTEADLTEAVLAEADFNGADLLGMDLTGTHIAWTVFGDVDLSVVRGLDTLKHSGPSTIGIDTIYRSHGNIPEIFLRDAGVPEEIITYMKSLVGGPFEFYSCFISYSSKDQEFAERLYADLRSKQVQCYFAPEDLKIGEKFRTSIDEAIRLRNKVLLVLSTHSMTSEWVETEVETAFEEEQRRKKTVLFPIRLDDSVIETHQAWAANFRRTRHIGDFRQWKDRDAYQQAFNRVLRDLKADN